MTGQHQTKIQLLSWSAGSPPSCRAEQRHFLQSILISFSSQISESKSNNKPRLRLSSLAIALLRTALTPLNLCAKLSLLSATQEIERSKVSHCKPSCCSSSRSMARPSRPQKSIKYVVSNVWMMVGLVPTSACSLDSLHIS